MNCHAIGEQVAQTLSTLPEWKNLEEFVSSFQASWLKLGQALQQQLVQEKIEEIETQYQGARTKRKKRYYTLLGEMVLKRRVYPEEDGYQVKVDLELGLPKEKWLPPVLELACALGVSSEFPNAHKLFQQWTGIKLTEKTLAIRVEATGNQLLLVEESRLPEQDKESEADSLTPDIERKERIYVGVDGVMTPLNQKQGYKEAKVGVIFWEKHHQKSQGQRGMIRQREYLATLNSRGEFRKKVSQLHEQVVGQQKPETIVIGDGAHWIWEMAQEQFPGSVEILDFFHLSEYVWAVAKEAYPKQESLQKDWVKQQQQFLKKSQWKQVIKSCSQFRSKRKDLQLAITNLERYLTNNQSRIDYQRYLSSGLMIGSGVVESSNRRVVTQRLKQAGMHWSIAGAEGVMALRAAYLSSSNRWSNIWSSRSKMRIG
ncbi:ISKra4 family transposase [Microcoleus sp. FACHB-53]|nr:ISKra4 family transposase [Microcoleus sp. FACHB-53]